MAKKILIVDDSPIVIFEISVILDELGFIIVGEANNGEAALIKMEELQPDIITLDIVMPGINGVEILKRIKSFDSRIKVIMLSAIGKQQTILDCLRAGADDFIEKPFVKEQIINILKKYL